MDDGDLTPDTRLVLAPRTRTRREASGHVLVDSPLGPVIDIGPQGHAVLALFSDTIALGDAIERLERSHRGVTGFAPTMGAINAMIEEGVLVPDNGSAAPSSGWTDPIEHSRMLHDDRRTGAFIAALEATVRPGDVVVDVGTGSGVLAVAAARAGARHVYAVEATDIAAVAQRVFERNGVQDRVTLVPGWSRHVELPEQADVLVSEVIGNEPLQEEILETTLDARQRLLAPGGRLIPHGLTLLARPIEIPAAEMHQRVLVPTDVERWRDLYGLDFTPLLAVASREPVHTLAEGEVAAAWPTRGPAVELGSLDLARLETPTLDASADLVVDEPGTVNAVAVTFRADLDAAISHTLDPWAHPASSWATSVWVLPEPLSTTPDDRLRVRYRRRVAGIPDGLTCTLIRP